MLARQGLFSVSRDNWNWYYSNGANTILVNEFFGEQASDAGKIKIWSGADWIYKPVKVWLSSAWVEKPVKRWNGTEWTLT